MTTALESFTHEAENPDSVIIWMHGLGADGHDFEPLMPVLGLPATRYIFPNAPVRPVTINGGMKMRAWYDLLSLDFTQGAGQEQIDDSVAAVQALMDEQRAQGIDASRIVLAGFSQGGVIALLAALTYDEPVAAVLALSTYLPKGYLHSHWQQQPPVLQCHGRQDPVIPFTVAEDSYQALEAAGIPVRFEAYSMAHGLCDEEISTIRQFLHHSL